MKSETHKVQLAFKDGVFPKELEDKFNVLNKSQLGQVYSVILNGDKEKIEKEINKYKPLVFDMIPLTLEEIFIYELGGKDYEINI